MFSSNGRNTKNIVLRLFTSDSVGLALIWKKTLAVDISDNSNNHINAINKSCFLLPPRVLQDSIGIQRDAKENSPRTSSKNYHSPHISLGCLWATSTMFFFLMRKSEVSVNRSGSCKVSRRQSTSVG